MGVMKTLSMQTHKRSHKRTVGPKKIVVFTIEGLPAVTAALRGFEPKVARKYLAKACRAAAKLVLATAKELTPVLTGALRASLKVRAKKRTRQNKTDVGASVQTGSAWFKGDTYYGGMIEFGTKHITARRFLRGARDKVEDRARDEFKRQLVAAVAAAGQGAP